MEEDSIGARVGRRNSANNAHSPRLRELAEKPSASRHSPYKTRKEKGCWDQRSRPGFVEETWDKVWERNGSREDGSGVKQYQCEACLKVCYRKKDEPTQDRADDATLDHNINWKKYIWENAACDDGGSPTIKGARDAYNAVKNLVVMCRSCNAKKNGPKNVFD